jgi:hypothetical protein
MNRTTQELAHPDHSARVGVLVDYFESLTPETVAGLGQHYHAQARFKDPFNDVVGVPAIASIFQHMFVTLVQPRFVVTHQVLQGAQCFLTWEFRFYFRSFRRNTAQNGLVSMKLARCISLSCSFCRLGYCSRQAICGKRKSR